MYSYSGAAVAYMDRCPAELVEHILKLVALDEDDDMPSRLLHTVNNTQVCKRWNGIISRPALNLWSNLFVITTSEGRIMPYSWIERIILKTQHSKTLHVHCVFHPSECLALSNDSDNQFISLIHKIWPRIESMILACDVRLYRPGERELLLDRKLYPHPASRDKGLNAFLDVVLGLFREFASKLKALYFGVLDHQEDEWARWTRPERFSDITVFPWIFDGKVPMLEHFESCHVTFHGNIFWGPLVRMNWCKNLRTFRMRSFNCSSVQIMRALEQMPLLETMEIADALSLTHHMYASQPRPDVIYLPRLTSMSINANWEPFEDLVTRIKLSSAGCKIHLSEKLPWDESMELETPQELVLNHLEPRSPEDTKTKSFERQGPAEMLLGHKVNFCLLPGNKYARILDGVITCDDYPSLPTYTGSERRATEELARESRRCGGWDGSLLVGRSSFKKAFKVL